MNKYIFLKHLFARLLINMPLYMNRSLMTGKSKVIFKETSLVFDVKHICRRASSITHHYPMHDQFFEGVEGKHVGHFDGDAQRGGRGLHQ